MNRLPLSLVTFLFLGIVGIPHSKSSYTNGNYSEAGGATRMCMRCHMINLNPSGASLTMSSSAASVTSGQNINITVNNSGFGGDWAPGVAVHFDFNSQFASRTPQEFGWTVASDPKGGPYNFVTEIAKNQPSVWTFTAPRKPGSYRIAVSAYFNDSSLATSEPGTVRGASSVAVQVNPMAEAVKPTVQAVVGRYKNYVFVKFSEAVNESQAGNVTHYSLLELATSAVLPIQQALVSRLGDVVTLRTGPQKAGTAYRLSVQGIQDYAATPNLIDPVSMDFTPNFTDPYRIYAEWSTDVSTSEIGENDEEDYLGNDPLNSINRLVHLFLVSDNPLDMLPGIDFSTAKVRVRQSGTTPPMGGSMENWILTRLIPSNEGWEFFGNMISSGGWNGPNVANQVLWSGGNPQSGSAVTLSRAVSSVTDGTPEIWWEWDVTGSFRPKYNSPGGTGNDPYYISRIQAASENTLAGGAVFYSVDAAGLDQLPHIELSIAPPDTVGISSVEGRGLSSGGLRVLKPSGDAVRFSVGVSSDREGFSELILYNNKGQRIRALHQGFLRSGLHTFDWDGKMLNGENAASGLYFVQLKSGRESSAKKFIWGLAK